MKRHRLKWIIGFVPYDSEIPVGPRGILSLSTDQYIDLVDWTGRQVREDKRGAIPAHLAPILVRLEIDTNRWVQTVQNYGSVFQRMVGKIDAMTAAAKQAGKHWWQGSTPVEMPFHPPDARNINNLATSKFIIQGIVFS